MQSPENPRRWFAVYVKPKHEKAASVALATKGLEELAPFYESRRRWADRIKTVQLPLFPGYVFCRFRHLERTSVLATPGVLSIVSFGSTLAPVEDSEIEAVRAAVNSGRPLQPWPNLAPGTMVRVARGVMEGVTGTLVRSKGQYRVIISVSLVQCSIAVEVDREDIRPVTINRPARVLAER